MLVHKSLDILRLQMEKAQFCRKKKKCIQMKNDCKPETYLLRSPETTSKVQYIQYVFAKQKCNETWY